MDKLQSACGRITGVFEQKILPIIKKKRSHFSSRMASQWPLLPLLLTLFFTTQSSYALTSDLNDLFDDGGYFATPTAPLTVTCNANCNMVATACGGTTNCIMGFAYVNSSDGSCNGPANNAAPLYLGSKSFTTGETHHLSAESLYAMMNLLQVGSGIYDVRLDYIISNSTHQTTSCITLTCNGTICTGTAGTWNLG